METSLGALKPTIDKRDYKVVAEAQIFPEEYEFKERTPIKNQGCVSSCVPHATATILEMLNQKETSQYIKLSTNFIYGMQGIVCNRAKKGMYLRDACKIIKEYGDPTENLIKGNTEQPECTNKLNKELNESIYKAAKNYKIKSYAKCQTHNDIKYAIINYSPVLASIKWYDKYSLENKIIKMDKNSENGYHAIVILGWNKQGWICQNSWGKLWNKGGYFIYPFEEQIREAWSFVDAENEDIQVIKTNKFTNFCYKIFNFICNLFSRWSN